MASGDIAGGWKFAIQIPFLCERHANIVYNSLRIDKEPRKSEVSRTFTVEGSILKMFGRNQARKAITAASPIKQIASIQVQTRDIFSYKNGLLPENTYCTMCLNYHLLRNHYKSNYFLPYRHYSDTDDTRKPLSSERQHGFQEKIASTIHFKKGVLSLEDIQQFLIDENGRDVFVMELSADLNYVTYFIVVTANSTRHLVHMAESLNRLYKQQKSPTDPFTRIEGKGFAKDWQCIDLGNSVVHFMLEEVREKYQLEQLWLLGPDYDDLLKSTPTLEEMLQRVSDKGLFLLSDDKNDVAFVDDTEIVNPWEMDYDKDPNEQDKPKKSLDDDDDAYII